MIYTIMFDYQLISVSYIYRNRNKRRNNLLYHSSLFAYERKISYSGKKENLPQNLCLSYFTVQPRLDGSCSYT